MADREGQPRHDLYSEAFYAVEREEALKSAKQIVPLVTSLVASKSVIDIGCGTGAWLKVFRDAGVENILGVDGPWVEERSLDIPRDRFLSHDLTQALRLDRSFDLAVSLDVAEHLPAASAPILVATLSDLAPVVLFSAAIPFQGGLGHVDEQWPPSWARLFEERGYVPIDALRPRIWGNPEVEVSYAQNIFIYARRDHLATVPALQEEFSRTRIGQLSIVHPLQYYSTCEPALLPIQTLVDLLVRRVARTVRSRLQPARRSQRELLTRARGGWRALTAARDDARRQ